MEGKQGETGVRPPLLKTCSDPYFPLWYRASYLCSLCFQSLKRPFTKLTHGYRLVIADGSKVHCFVSNSHKSPQRLKGCAIQDARSAQFLSWQIDRHAKLVDVVPRAQVSQSKFLGPLLVVRSSPTAETRALALAYAQVGH